MRGIIGIILRAPVVAVLTALWVITLWPLIVGFNLLGFILQPLAYPFIYTIVWLKYAFLGKGDKVLSDYWENFPTEYFSNMETGFPTLHKWLWKGFVD